MKVPRKCIMCIKFIIIFIAITNFPFTIESVGFVMNSYTAYNLFEGCINVDIRHNIQYFDQLKNCKRVYGGLRISNFFNTVESDFKNLSFPLLTEISGYLYIDSVSGLNTLQDLFPNLAVIRGDILLHHAALLIINNLNMIHIGLVSLAHIGRGDVIIKSNPKLCFVDTIEWSLFYKTQNNHNLIFKENNSNNCESCMRGIGNCWNKENAQMKCNSITEYCSSKKEKCDDVCLGTCSEQDLSQCSACKNQMSWDGDGSTGTIKCVKGKINFDDILYNERYLINEKLCYDMNGIPLDGECLEICPLESGHVYNESQKICIYSDKLVKSCQNAITINGIKDLFDETVVLGCTHIPEVIIRNIKANSYKSIDEIFTRLLEVFGKLGNIRGSLRIEGNDDLTNLYFFENLKSIRGSSLDPENGVQFSLIIKNNKKLQQLFRQKVSVTKAGIFIESNPSICLDDIEYWKNNLIGNKEYDTKMYSFQNSSCKIPIVNFNVLVSFNSVLILIDKLAVGIIYKLWYCQKDSCNNWEKVEIHNESFEVKNLIPNTTYVSYISSKKNSSEATFQFESKRKVFTLMAYGKYIKYAENNENTTTNDSITVMWKDQNDLSKNSGVFYLIEIIDNHPATRIGKLIKGKYNYQCNYNNSHYKRPSEYDIYYLPSSPNRTPNNSTFTTQNSHFYIKNLLPLYCYTISISICQRANVLRCSEPEIKTFQTKEVAKIVTLTFAQKIAAFFIPLIVITVYGTFRLTFSFSKLKKKQSLDLNPQTPIDDIIRDEYVSFDMKGLIDLRKLNFEIKLEAIQKNERIGGGHFGDIFKGIWINEQGESIEVALKTVKDAGDDNYQKFIEEALNLRSIQTHHIVKAYGCILIRIPWIVMEYMENKDLRSFLIDNKPVEDECQDVSNSPGYVGLKSSNRVRPIFDMAVEIADGMAYLECKNIVHRDLACRNCMVSEDLTIKIGDFGMTRNLGELNYVRENFEVAVPVRWMSPESLNSVYSTQGDVWSFGVVLWEIINYGDIPYGKIENQIVVQLIKAGVNLLKLYKNSLKCEQKILDIMEMCFQETPTDRISFVNVVKELYPLITNQNKFQSVSFYHNQYPKLK